MLPLSHQFHCPLGFIDVHSDMLGDLIRDHVFHYTPFLWIGHIGHLSGQERLRPVQCTLLLGGRWHETVTLIAILPILVFLIAVAVRSRVWNT